MEVWRGPDCFRAMLMPLSALHEDPRNARRHSERNIEVIRASMASWGQDQPVVALANGRVIIGNGRLRAARLLGWTHLAVVRTMLDERAAILRALADNKSAELASWDFDVLRSDFEEVDGGDLNVDLSGFDSEEIESIATYAGKDEAERGGVTCPECGNRFIPSKKRKA